MILSSTDTLITTERLLINDSDIDEYGQLKIGNLLEECDLTTCMSAEKLCKMQCVTAQVDDLLFEDVLCRTGDVLIIKSQVTRAFKSSLECFVTVDVESLEAGTISRVCSSYFVYVAINTITGKAQPVPEMKPGNSKIELFNWTFAADRKDIRLNRSKIENKLATTTTSSSKSKLNINTTIQNSIFNSTNIKNSTNGGAIIQKLVLPPNTNHNGSTFGGVLMNWALEAGLIACRRHCFGKPINVIAIDDVYFVAPSRVGHRVLLKASVNRVFEKDIEVGVRIEGIQINGTITLIARCYFTMTLYIPNNNNNKIINRQSRWDVTKNELDLLSIIPQVPLLTSDQNRRYSNALGRKNVRLERLILRGRIIKTDNKDNSIGWNFPKDPNSIHWNTDIRSIIHQNIYAFSRISLPDENSENLSINLWNDIYQQNGIEIKTRVVNNSSVQFRSSININALPKICFDAVFDIKQRILWDKSTVSLIIKKQIDETNDVIQLIRKPFLVSSSSSTDKNNIEFDDYALIRSWRNSNSDGQIFIAQHSVNAPSIVPEESKYYRKEVASSGFLFQKTDKNQTDLIYVISESKLLVSSEIDRYCKVIIQGLLDLKLYCEGKLIISKL